MGGIFKTGRVRTIKRSTGNPPSASLRKPAKSLKRGDPIPRKSLKRGDPKSKIQREIR